MAHQQPSAKPEQRHEASEITVGVMLYFAGVFILALGLASKIALAVVMGGALFLAAGGMVGACITRRRGYSGLGPVLDALLGVIGWALAAVLVIAMGDKQTAGSV